MTSSTSAPSTFARSRAALTAMAPSSWAGVLAKAPLNEPTAVRVAPTMTMLVMGSTFMVLFRDCIRLPAPITRALTRLRSWTSIQVCQCGH